MELDLAGWTEFMRGSSAEALAVYLTGFQQLATFAATQLIIHSARKVPLDVRPPPHGLMTVPEAARYLHLHQETVRRYVRTGTLQSEKVGRCVRVHPSSLEGFINGRRNPDSKA